MITVKTSVTDRATPVVLAIADVANPARLKPVVGRAGVNLIRRHLVGLDRSRPNALGGPRTHFYGAAARGTHFTIEADGVTISINSVGIRQRIVGGTIRPKAGKKFLTIPARPEAYGKRASEFNDLVLLRRGDHKFGKPYALARAVQTTLRVTGAATAKALGEKQLTRGGETGGEILFWLKEAVTQRGDPSVIPTTFDIYAAIKSSVNDLLARDVARARATTQGGK